ncbi:WSC-domain-containing protein [Aureobasidium melanogenum CBS 110374]|uniref:WSC-domain-containing protein n=1 Tax=Aureobasidium melanogenum (strain CBS 110374) TaxID=1043003 RepID=A0A074VT69_AURM1|nr:WSC-domain-containing protein [Aureobasidium melanogenum CBS 110374]KEQ63603.1 WSC-domain-containing protein [Aureobasidium melanogenum CBS 110374]
MASTAGRARLFSDNFYGDGAKSYDFGYPRIQANVDDPYPNPAYNSSSTSANPGVYANNMTYAGCYTDSGSRTLANMLYDSQSNTVEMCTSACAKAGYAIAGMEYGSQCWCDNTIGPYTQKVLDLGCSEACPGNSTENCGQSNRLQLYSNSTLVQASAPSNPEVVGNYYYSGCHNESTSGRALSATSYSDGKNMTLENCAAFCNGYQYFGIEYAAECYCGSYFGVGSTTVSDSSCAMTCTGNSLELCGGPGTLSVYELSDDANVVTITQGSTTAGTSSTALSLPTGFSSYGCFIDSSTRALSYSAYSRSDNTPYKCASTCQSLGYKYAGTEYGSECWCSNTAPTSSAKATDCNMACSGDSTQTCGAGNRLSVYVDNTWVSKFNARQSYGTWNLMACYTDNTNGRVLPTTMSMTGGASNATIANCLDACAKSGLKVCGAEYYQECYGGSVAPSSSLIAGSDPLAAGCNYPCNGNKTEACGGSNKILVYVNNGTVSASAGARRRW